jgi:hypothetical protein
MNNDKKIPWFWIAFYKDGSFLSQFDLVSGKQNLFKEINQSELEKFGWFPIPLNLIDKLPSEYYHDRKLSYFILKINEKQKLIALRRETQSFFTYTHCLNCGFIFQWMPNQPDGSIGDSGLPRYGSEKYHYSKMQTNGKLAFEVICPKCGAKNDLKCPKCDEWWNKVNDLPKEKCTYHLECPKCKDIYEKKTIFTGGQKISCEWLLGYQETLSDGSNKEHIMSIDRDGIIQLK